MVYKVINTKTTAGERTIPMTDDVYECFKKIVEMRKKVKAEPVIDGKLGFLYLDKNNNRWLHYTGRNIFNISEKNTIAFIRNRCLLLHRMFAVILTALIWLRSGMNPKTLQVFDGTFWYIRNSEYIYSLKIWGCESRSKKNYEAQLMYFEQFTSFEFASDFLRINIKCMV